MPADFSFSESGNSPCMRTLVFRKVEVHLACKHLLLKMGGGIFKKCAFFTFSKVEIHNACKHLLLKMGGGIFKKCAFFAFSIVEIHNACNH